MIALVPVSRPIVSLSSASRARPRRAFTLIEIVVVISLIIVLVGGFGFALRDNAGSSLVRAQNTLAALVATARSQAVVNQTEAILAISAVRGDAAGTYLRLCQVFIASPAGSPNLVAVGSPVLLPAGIYIVPPTTTGLTAAGVIWPTNPAPVSNFAAAARFPPAGQTPGNQTFSAGTPFNLVTQAHQIQFNSDGSILNAPAPYLKIALTTGGLSTTNLPAFNNQFAVRGLILRPSGALSYVNEAAGF